MSNHDQVPGQGPATPPTDAPGQGPVRAHAPAPNKDLPQYKLKQTAYLHDRVHQEGDTVYWNGRPEHYMTPLNKAARDAFAAAGNPKFTDPVGSLPIAPDPAAQS
jgi:hypothetical protein